MRDNTAVFLKSAGLALCYCAGFLALQFFLAHTGFLQASPSKENLAGWDVQFYRSIAQHGYVYGSNNTGFYLLFPLLWKIVGAGIWAGIVLNVLLFSAGFGVLCMMAPQSTEGRLVWLSTPSLFFMMVPYSEALFFLLFALSIYGILKESGAVTAISLLLLACTRATALILLPALAIALLMSRPLREWKNSIKFILLFIALPIIAGLIFFLGYQYLQTGIWGAYFKTQSEVWNHKIVGLRFPLKDAYGAETRINWLNAAAFFTGIACLVLTIRSGLLWLMRRDYYADKIKVAACAYLACVVITTLLYNPQEHESTVSSGMHRYVFATPAFFLLLSRLQMIKMAGWKLWTGVIILANFCWLLFGEYVHPQEVIFFNCITLMVIAYLLFFSKKETAIGYFIFGINVLLQVMLYQQFMLSAYVD